MKQTFLLLALLCFSLMAGSQGFIAPVNDDDFSVLLANECTVTREDGTKLTGKLSSGTLINGYLKSITVKTDDGEKHKFKPEEMTSVWVKASKLVKLAMISESTTSIKELAKADFEEIDNREYVIFERAALAKKDDKYAMMQLLNPGFDSKIKVYADPIANQTTGLGMGGVQFTGGEDKSYLFVKKGEKTVITRKKNYSTNFEELYSDCPEMLTAFAGNKIKWQDLAGHVFAYDQVCE